ncbi:MAG TPA: DUF1835 domain-containing protein [Vicinamibacterales bacterium]|nr:DUF1835 domain-containing protein [Vicinamibacterales bacterium]
MIATRPRMRHLTNGSSVIPLIREAGLGGPIVAWDDVLHEGPVPAGLGTAALRERRAEFLASCGWGSRDSIARDLATRDAAIEDLGNVDEVVLWFEHDLYDQLQLLQILDRLPLDGAPRLTAVPDDTYLGTLPASHYQGLFAARRDVTTAERLAARDAWLVFRSPDPRVIIAALPRLTVLPHLGPALRRHAEQFPSMRNGLSRTEQQALEVLAAGSSTAGDLYVKAHHGREPAVFMGDAAFLMHLGALLQSSRPLIRTARASKTLALDDHLGLTDDGRRVLDGQLDRVVTSGIDRWLGGVHLTGHGPMWRWDDATEALRFL